MTHRRAVTILIAVTCVWGASFTINKMALGSVTPLLLLGTRSMIAALLLSPMYGRMTRADWRAGASLGLLFGFQLSLFINGLDRIPASRAAFLFSAATPLVPLLMLVVGRQRPRPRHGIGVALAVAGTWFLTNPGASEGGLNIGDAFVLLAAACGAVYVVWAGHLAPRHQPLRLLAAQMPVITAVALGLALLTEQSAFDVTPWSVYLVGFLALSSIATFGGQLTGQRLVPPTEAAIIFALEPVAAAAASYAALGERLVGWQWLGGGLILAAMFAARPAPRGETGLTPSDTAPPLASTVD